MKKKQSLTSLSKSRLWLTNDPSQRQQKVHRHCVSELHPFRSWPVKMGEINDIHFNNNVLAVGCNGESTEEPLRNLNFCFLNSNEIQSVVTNSRISELAVFENRIATGCYNGLFQIWENGTQVYSFDCGAEILKVAQKQTDSRLLATGTSNGRLNLHCIEGMYSLDIAEGGIARTSDLCFGDSGLILYSSTELTGSRKANVTRWDVENWTKPTKIYFDESVSSIDLSPSGSLLAAGHFYTNQQKAKQCLNIVSFQSKSIVYSLFTGQIDVNIVGFSPCGMFVYSAAADNSCVIYDLRNPNERFQTIKHGKPIGFFEEKDGIADATWLPESNLLVTGGEDAVIRFWDIKLMKPSSSVSANPKNPARGQVLEVKDPRGLPVNRIRFSESEDVMVTANQNFINMYSFRSSDFW